MMGYKLGLRSKQRLSGVHPDLVAVVKRAIEISEQDFSVTEGIRHIERQRMLVATGKSTTMNSRHLTGHAVDLVPYPVSWDWEHFYPIADAVILAAKEVDVPIRWGGNWQVNDVRQWDGSALELRQSYTGEFNDGPHIEIPRGFGYD
jgi:peptidoglycan LD-endopeptidase CwlK